MFPSLRACAEHARKPLINFIGKRKWPSTPEPPHAHPAAPPELRKAFPDFLRKFEASASSGASPKKSESGKQAYSEFWEAPSRFWVKELDEAEIDAISSGGASLH
ncbi:hypothetical protein PLICRDRAFT_151203 [Plicaturopsis crispa FD-325 SS-3]|nr:hypothetical protein PLICRDRAFT_151203 [Plicaturopsis crispa FD-325 SS-3]